MAERAGRIDPGQAVHLLVGEEAWLRDRRARELIEALAPADNAAYNQETFQGPEIDLDQVVSACETLPVFAERRLVVLRQLDWKAAASHERFVSYLRRPNPTTRLLIVGEPPAARREGPSEEQRPAAKGKKGIAVKDLLGLLPSREDFPAMRAEEAVEFVRRAAKQRGAQIATQVAAELVELVGSDAGRLDDEVEKATLLVGGKGRIDLADIVLLARRTRSHTMFELTDAIARADRPEVLRHLNALLEDGAEPVALVGMIAWHLRRSLKGAALLEAGRPPAEAARLSGVYWKLADRFTASCRKLGTLGVARAVRALRLADRRIKSTGEDERLVLERTLLELLSTVGTGAGPAPSRPPGTRPS